MTELTIDQALQQGIEAHKAGRVQEADRLYTAILKAQPKHPDANHNMGVLAVNVGKVELALPFFKTALEANPATAQFWLSYIDALIRLDKLADAKAVLDQAKSKGAKGESFDKLEQRLNETGEEPVVASELAAAEPQPRQPNILDTLKLDQAIKLAKKKSNEGSTEEAKRIYQDILAKFPKNKRAADGIRKLAGKAVGKVSDVQDPPQDQLEVVINLYKQGRPQQALLEAKSLTQRFPQSSILFNIQGAVMKSLGHFDEAIEAYKKTIAIKPDFAEAYYNMGNTLKEQGKLEEAIETYKKTLAIKPDYAEAYNNIGIALKEQGKPDAAIKAYYKALTIKSDYAEAFNNLGVVLKDQGNLEGAIELYNKALAIKPNYPEAYNNTGIALKSQGKLEEAIQAYNKALAIEPDYPEAHENLSFALLSANQLSEGFKEYEWRWKTKEGAKSQRHFLQPLWDGKTSLKGKRILLWCEQGVGDTINWSSGLEFLASRAQHCILECQEKLIPLLSRSFPNVEVTAENICSDFERFDFDLHLPMGSLYQHFISEFPENKKSNAFLVPDPVRIRFWRNRLSAIGKGPFIGVSWKSANMSPMRLPNYAPISDWSPIFAIPNVTFINLQYTDFLDDLTKIKKEFGVTVHNFDDLDHYNDLDDVAALCAALDIVVSTKITVPLISAGVGTVTKLANWRQSPWNNILLNPVGPLVDIFEKNTSEPWKNVFESITKDISILMKNMNDN